MSAKQNANSFQFHDVPNVYQGSSSQRQGKGNTAFKKGDFPSAIGHYSQAILEDPKDWTFHLNRAAAYLKLGKNEDAEKGCTAVLALNASNVKALFRRAQARKELGKLVEAQKVKDLLWKKSTSDVVHPLRRRVPIKIIEPSDSSSDVAVAAKTSASASSESSSAANTKAIAKDAGQTSEPTEDGKNASALAPTLTSTSSGSPSTSVSLPHTPLSSTTSPPKNVTESPSLSSPTTKTKHSSSAPEIPSASSDIQLSFKNHHHHHPSKKPNAPGRNVTPKSWSLVIYPRDIKSMQRAERTFIPSNLQDCTQ
ncbi:TPR-like protein [Gymnopus androsaceus JB14]|uniref:TPR-like protein n=1 Tax=Gymnopus androsaceus JB14 TaxID=1447944 RepID=A0A6A4GZ17_9AGAR|nr:TPR-like protein [Gymnopus androsaceus JB14]